MKLKRRLIFLCTAILCLNSGCVGLNDWTLDLPNDYAIWHINANQIICGKKDGESSLSRVTERYVLEFCYNEQYIGLKCIDDYESYSTGEDTEIFYYMIDTLEDDVTGPLDFESYSELCENINIFEDVEWIPTNPTPENAQFPNP